MRQLRAQVVVSFPPDAADGQSDHIAISQLTDSALGCAADAAYLPCDGPPHRTDRFYSMVDYHVVLETHKAVVVDQSIKADGGVRRVVSWKDRAITTRLATAPHWRTASRALRSQ